MARPGRYDKTPAFQPDPRGNSAFQGIRPRHITPATGVIEHRVAAGERLDRLADHYFNDDRLWWRIADATSAFLFAPDMLLDLPTKASDAPDPLGRSDMVDRTIIIPAAEE